MECLEVAERLAFLINGSLVPEERAAVEAHLDRCDACRRELRETRRAAQLFDAHLPRAAIADLAWDRPVPGFDGELAGRHLESCPDCAEELALARESRKAGEALPFRSPARLRVRAIHGALAAGLVVAFSAGLFLGHDRLRVGLSAAEAERVGLAERVASAEARAEELRDVEARLRGRIDELAAPQLNLPVVEVLPAREVQRSRGSADRELRLPRQTRFVAVLLGTTASPQAPVSAVIRDAAGTVLWEGRGLRQGDLGGYTLGLPAALLPEGRVTIDLHAEGGSRPFETYRLDVRRGR